MRLVVKLKSNLQRLGKIRGPGLGGIQNADPLKGILIIKAENKASAKVVPMGKRTE